MITPFDQQLVYAYEDMGLSPAVIAEQFEEPLGGPEAALELVTQVLADQSSKYRAFLRVKEGNPTGTDEELLELESEYRRIALSSKNELVKERALKFLINEKKGRNDLGERTLKLKERQLNIAEVDTKRRGEEFRAAMSVINQKIQEALGLNQRTIELPSSGHQEEQKALPAA